MAVYAQTGETETFRFIPLSELHPDHLTLPIDKVVAEMVRGES